MVKAYCLTEKKHIEAKSPKYELNARGSPAVRGTCPDCGGKVYGIISRKDAPKELLDKMAERKPGAKKTQKRGGGSRKSTSRKSRAVKSRKPKSRSASRK